MQYRIYLMGAGDRIQAAESFIAGNDREATEIVTALYANCSTSFQSAELWQGPRMVMRRISDNVYVTDDLKQLVDKRQESIAELEEMLERSFTCIRDAGS